MKGGSNDEAMPSNSVAFMYHGQFLSQFATPDLIEIYEEHAGVHNQPDMVVHSSAAADASKLEEPVKGKKNRKEKKSSKKGGRGRRGKSTATTPMLRVLVGNPGVFPSRLAKDFQLARRRPSRRWLMPVILASSRVTQLCLNWVCARRSRTPNQRRISTTSREKNPRSCQR